MIEPPSVTWVAEAESVTVVASASSTTVVLTLEVVVSASKLPPEVCVIDTGRVLLAWT